MDYEGPSLRRRRLLAAAGAGAATCATGCLGSTEGAVGDEGEKKDSDGENETAKADLRMEPVEYPDKTCAVDARNVREYPGWNAQILHTDGKRAFFCTSGDMGAYYALPNAFGGSDAEIAGIWVTEYETGETIDGKDAYYVFASDPTAVDMPAGRNPIPFAERERAAEFVGSSDELRGSDIVELSRTNFNRCVR